MQAPMLAMAVTLGLTPLLNADSPVTVKVQVPSETPAARRLVLHVDGLQLPPGSSGVVRIYANFPKADSTTGMDTPHFLGYIALTARTSHEAPAERNISLDVSGKSSEIVGDRDVSITLVPMTGREVAPQSSEKLTYRRLYLSRQP